MPTYFTTARPNGGTREYSADLADALARLEAAVGHNSGADPDLVMAFGRIARACSPVAALRVGQTYTIERIA